MAATKFTPGPWRRDDINDVRSVGGGHDEMIAFVDVVDAEECRATADLISAAPEMYEALRGFSVTGPDADGLLWLRFKVGGKEAAISCRADGMVGSVVDEFQVECVAALAKAEGR